jgi:hypothetical protein
VEVGLLDCGNVHDNWHRAQYQNTRAKQTYSMAVSLLTQQMTTDLDLFDPFLYTPMLPGTDGKITPDERNKAVFIVTAKSIKVAGGNYFERFEGMTQGPAIDPSASGSLV